MDDRRRNKQNGNVLKSRCVDFICQSFLNDDLNLFVGVSNHGMINFNPDSRCGKSEITNNQSQMTNFSILCPKKKTMETVGKWENGTV